MNLFNFVLIDLILLIVGVYVLWLLKIKTSNPLLSDHSDDKKNILEAPYGISNINELLELEKLARKDGSGIELGSLIGLWRFLFVWKNGEEKIDSISSSLLKFFSASLELKNIKLSEKFCISSSIQFGALSLRFMGSGYLQGSQPLLMFYFERIELVFGTSILFSRDLVIPKENNFPFFALISMDENKKCLAARGRGGGLAVWIRD